MSSPVISGYKFDGCRGSGTFGSVWKALWNGEFECAVKVLTPGTFHPHYLSWCLERLRKEGERSDFVRIYSYDLSTHAPHLTMALLPEGALSLEQLAGRLPVREAWTLLDSLANTLAWLHTEGIVHTGLSGGNVFVCSGPSGEPAVLVGDVGQGWLTGAPVTRLHEQMGFIPPEHWRSATRLLEEGQAHGRDVYAFGVIAWRLLCGSWPRGTTVFDSIVAGRTEELNLEGESFAEWLEKEPSTPWPAEPATEEEAARRKIVEQCLSLDPAARFSDMKAAVEALQKCALPPQAAAGENAAIGEKGTADAFDGDKPAPRRRRFFRRFSRVSKELQENHKESRSMFSMGAGMAVFSLLAIAGIGAYAFKERTRRLKVESDLGATRSTVEELSSRLPRMENDAAAARAETQTVKAEQATALLKRGMELIARVLASKPLEDDEVPGWRTAVRAVALHCSDVLENAPADGTGMEARWQLASLKSALGDDTAALPILEKLTRDLEAAAIAAAGDFPLDLIGLTGRVESLIGSILSAQHRIEDALPHLRKASDSFEKWVAAHKSDAEAARAYARNLYLEGHALAERGQAEPARDALIKIVGLVGKPENEKLAPEDRFLLADAQIELARIDAAEAASQPSTDEGARQKSAQLLEEAFNKHSGGVDLLYAYDKENPKSIPCRSRLAHGYFELGRLLIRLDRQYDASIAFNESVKLYLELVREQQDNPDYTTSLATVYNEVAQLKYANNSTPAGAKEALGYQNSGVEFLENLNGSTPLNNGIRLLLATSWALNGELLQHSGDHTNALKRQTEAISLTTELMGENSLSEKERRECRRISARAWTATARLHERAGPSHREDAVAALTKAYADWESSPVEDPQDQNKMAWVKEKLNKLKPPVK
ncbi:MAG TPA: protein kinase [Verrucomicrobiales bacterium]|nr:protein kinase [Verrucomicrobiales bacterium]